MTDTNGEVLEDFVSAVRANHFDPLSLDFTNYDPLFDAKMDRRDRALRHVRSAFLMDDPYLLVESCCVLRRLLTETELVALGWGILRALPIEIAVETANGAIGGVGVPDATPHLLGANNAVGDAKFWTAFASQNELKAFAMQAFLQMPPSVKKSFKKWLRSA